MNVTQPMTSMDQVVLTFCFVLVRCLAGLFTIMWQWNSLAKLASYYCQFNWLRQVAS